VVLIEYRVRYLVEDDGCVLAVFTDSAADCAPGHLLVYSPVGEHSEASTDYLRRLLPAEEPQYRDLHTYLSTRYPARPGTPLHLIIDTDGAPR